MNEIEFCRWEQDCFGFGYGTGEEYVLKAVKDFFGAIPKEGSYSHLVLEATLSAPVAWLLINDFCKWPRDKRLAKDSVIEYGTSPRFGWLTNFGREIQEFVNARSLEDLLRILGEYDAMKDPVYEVPE